MRNKTTLVALAAVLLFSAAAKADRKRIFVIEVDAPAASGEPESLTLTFYAGKPTADAAEKILRSSMQQVLDHQKPPPAIFIGTAWDGVGKAEGDEDEIALPDGSTSLIADKKTGGKILSGERYAQIK